MNNESAEILIQGLYKRFGDVDVLKGISLTADKGSIVSLLGSSGSGKSTLLRCINLLETPDRGVLKVCGETILFKNSRGKRLPKDKHQVLSLRRRVGMVFQSFNLWTHRTALENVIEAPIHALKIPKKEAVEMGRAMLRKVGLIEKADSYPHQLSGGQQQRVGIARVLAMEPKVLLFDEPTSALDPELVGEVLGVIRNLAKEGRTMIIVTHEIGFAREVSSKVAFLNEGRIEEEGPPDEIIDRPQSKRCQQFLATEL